jgi:hypothetical protein
MYKCKPRGDNEEAIENVVGFVLQRKGESSYRAAFRIEGLEWGRRRKGLTQGRRIMNLITQLDPAQHYYS